MRPEEIDYSDTRKHYFDISNGEVLAGIQDRARYIENGGDQNFVFDMGLLLRNPQPFVEIEQVPYEPLDTTDWPHNRYKRFARWLNRLVDPPEQPDQENITKEVFHNARALGVGPGRYMIEKEFGSYSRLYADAKITDSRVTGLLRDWDVEKAVAYIRRVGKGSRPMHQDLKLLNESNPRNPSGKSLNKRFAHIGGFKRLVVLAGYPAPGIWDKQDYIGWGVKFMQANDGQVPKATMMRYMSSIRRGPSERPLGRYFEGLSDFQEQITERFYEQQQEAELTAQQHLSDIKAALQGGQLPLLLFSPFPHGSDLRQVYDCDDPVQKVIDEIGLQETLARYAKYKVVEVVANSTTTDTKIRIARGIHDGMDFVSAIKYHKETTAGDIECEALCLGVFDYIWPMDDHIETLKLGEGYEEYKAAHYKPRPRSARRRALAT